MDSLGDVFTSSMARYSKRADFKAGMSALAWNKVLGPEVSAHLQLVRIDSGVAWVRPSSPAWAHQLTFLKAEVLTRLAAELGARTITDIRTTRMLAMRPAPAPALVPLAPLQPEQTAMIHACGAEVHDPALKRAFEVAMTAVLQRQSELERQGLLSCLACGALTEAMDRTCFLCRRAARQERRNRIVQLLRERPWSGLWDLRMQMPDLEPVEYGRWRATLLRTTWATIAAWLDRHKKAQEVDTFVALEIKTHIMLRVMRPWDQVDLLMVEHYGGKRIRFLMDRSGLVTSTVRRAFGQRANERQHEALPLPRLPGEDQKNNEGRHSDE